MTDDNMTTSYAELNAAPPKCDAQLGPLVVVASAGWKKHSIAR